MNRRTLGAQGLEVSAEGLGCMGMTHAYGRGDERSGLETIHRALELGITFLDTAEVYGPYTNEELVGRAVAGRRDQFEIATKFGFVIDPEQPSDRSVDGRPENVHRAREGSGRKRGGRRRQAVGGRHRGAGRRHLARGGPGQPLQRRDDGAAEQLRPVRWRVAPLRRRRERCR